MFEIQWIKNRLVEAFRFRYFQNALIMGFCYSLQLTKRCAPWHQQLLPPPAAVSGPGQLDSGEQLGSNEFLVLQPVPYPKSN